MKQNGAIENDALADVDAGEIDNSGDEGHQEAREPLPRDIALAEIARENERLLGIEREEEEQEGDSGKEADSGEQQSAGGQDPLSDLGFYKNAKGELVTKIKVNGEEREVPAGQVKQYLQKDLAGDLKLQQAFTKEQQLQQREQQLMERENQLRQTATQKRPSEQDATKLRDTIRAAFDKVYDGDVDSATETLLSVMLERGDATPTEEQIDRAVMNTLQKQEAAKQQQAWEQSVNEGNRQLAANHPEIYQDEYLFSLVNEATAKMLEKRDRGDPEYINLMPAQIIAKAAEDVREWLGHKRTPGTNAGSREQRKAGLKPVITGSSARPKAPAKQEVDLSPAAVIQRMAKARATAINRGA
jgi:hypothetical protein